MSALDLVTTIQDDITCTNATQIQVEELIFAVDDVISRVETDIDIVRNVCTCTLCPSISYIYTLFHQVCSLVSDLEEIYSCAVTTYNATLELIRVASALGISNRAATSQLLNRATMEAEEARQYRNVCNLARTSERVKGLHSRPHLSTHTCPLYKGIGPNVGGSI